MICETLDTFLQRDDPVSRLLETFFQTHGLLTVPEGRYELLFGAYASVQQYKTCYNRRFEAHRKYIDIQLLASGEERIFTAPLAAGVVEEPYIEKKDIGIYRCFNRISAVDLTAGQLVILFPEDLHAPSNSISGPTTVRKLVFKIPVSRWEESNDKRAHLYADTQTDIYDSTVTETGE